MLLTEAIDESSFDLNPFQIEAFELILQLSSLTVYRTTNQPEIFVRISSHRSPPMLYSLRDISSEPIDGSDFKVLPGSRGSSHILFP